MLNAIKRFFSEESGQGMAEYGLILALVAVAVIAGLGLIGDNLQLKFNEIATDLQ